MKDRIRLSLLIIFLWIFLIIFQKYTPIQTSLFVIFGFILAYTVLIQIAQKHQKRKMKKKPIVLNYNYKPFVSILVPGHNEEAVIEDTVNNMLAIDYENYELIVIDDRSTDKTADIIRHLESKYEKVKAIVRSQDAFPGKSAVLNEALEISKGEIIAVFDADARIEPDFFNRILPYIEDKEIGAVQARKVINNFDFNFLTRCQENEYALDTHFQAGRDSIKGAVELRGNGQILRKEALIDVNGWNVNTITDDLDLSTRLHLKGWDVRFCPSVNVYEEGVLEFIPLLRQRRRWVEGSIRRYLDHFTEVLFSREISLRVALDMLAYIAEFVLPVWLLSEWAIQGFNWIKGYNNHILFAVAILPFLGVFFVSGLIYSLRKYRNISLLETVKQAIETSIYVIAMWTPLVIYIVLKIIFTKRTLDWGKTEHGVQQESEVQLATES